MGTLEPGRLADLAGLSADPLSLPDTEIHAIKAQLTMVGGTIVHDGGDWHARLLVGRPMWPDLQDHSAGATAASTRARAISRTGRQRNHGEACLDHRAIG